MAFLERFRAYVFFNVKTTKAELRIKYPSEQWNSYSLPKRNQSKRVTIKQNAQSFKVCTRELKLTLVAFWVSLLDGKIQTQLFITSFSFFFFFSFQRKFLKNISAFSSRTKMLKYWQFVWNGNHSFEICQVWILVLFNLNYLVLWLKSLRKASWIK